MTTAIMPQPPARPEAPRVYRVTPARARAYGLCPLQCLDVQIHRRHRPSAFTGEAALRGRSLHALLLEYNRAVIRDGRPPDVDDTIHRVWAPGVFPAAGEQGAVDLARRTLHAYGDFLGEEGLTVLSAEEWVKTAPRPLLDAPHLAIELSGTPDVLARRSDGSVVALDLKTGASLPDPSALADDLGTVVYHLLAAYRCDTTAIEVAQVAPHRGDWVAVALDGAGPRRDGAPTRHGGRDGRGRFPAAPGAALRHLPCGALVPRALSRPRVGEGAVLSGRTARRHARAPCCRHPPPRGRARVWAGVGAGRGGRPQRDSDPVTRSYTLDP